MLCVFNIHFKPHQISFNYTLGLIINCLKQDTIHTATIPCTINATNTGRDLVCYVKGTIAILCMGVQSTHFQERMFKY